MKPAFTGELWPKFRICMWKARSIHLYSVYSCKPNASAYLLFCHPSHQRFDAVRSHYLVATVAYENDKKSCMKMMEISRKTLKDIPLDLSDKISTFTEILLTAQCII